MKPKFYIPILTLALLSLAGVGSAQDGAVDTVGSLPGIQVETSVDKAEIYIGDLITYTVAITYDTTIELIPPPLGANLGAFDVKDYHPDIETKLPDGRIRSETVFKVSTFTTGDYVIPPVPVIFNMPDSSRKAVLAEPVPIKVLSMLENAGDSVDIHPLKAQFEFQRDYTSYYIWGALALVVVIGAVILIWSIIRRRKLREEPVDMRPPWEIAFEKLAVLKEKNLIAQEQYKEFYFELTEIYRGFLGRVYDIDVLEMTTDEFVERFEKIELPGNIYDDSTSLLRSADLVKFAKQIPETGRPDADLKEAHDMIETIRVDQERKAQVDVHIDHNGEKPVPETTEVGR